MNTVKPMATALAGAAIMVLGTSAMYVLAAPPERWYRSLRSASTTRPA